MSKDGSVQFIKNESGTQLALTYFQARTPSPATNADDLRGPILLAHGTFSNHRSMRGLSQYLSDIGYDCWILDFQGHGYSAKPANAPDFEQMCIEDAAAAITYVKKLYPLQRLIWIGHSGGGLAALMLLARKPENATALKAVVTVASQTTHSAMHNKNRLIILLSRFITRTLGVAPGKYFKLGPQNEFGPVMAQWYGWALTGNWLAKDDFDYLHELSAITTPTLMLAGSGDTFIAPPAGCKVLFDKLGSEKKEFKECGLDTGFIENYNHSRIISSRNASKEIWPVISDWLNGLRVDN